MLSLENAFAAEEVAEFDDRVRKFLGHTGALCLHRRAEDRRVVAVASLCGRAFWSRPRPGATARWAKTSPRTPAPCRHPPAPDRRAPQVLEVRGEVYMSHADFAAIERAGGGAKATRPLPTLGTPPPDRFGSLTPASPPAARSASSPIPGARFPPPCAHPVRSHPALKALGFQTNPLTVLCDGPVAMLAHYRKIEAERATWL